MPSSKNVCKLLKAGEGRVKEVSDLLNHISFLKTHKSAAVTVKYNIQKGRRKKKMLRITL